MTFQEEYDELYEIAEKYNKLKKAIEAIEKELADLTKKENNVGFISGEYAIELIDKHTKELM